MNYKLKNDNEFFRFNETEQPMNIFKDRTLKKNNIERTRISMWFGRENDENVVRTRD